MEIETNEYDLVSLACCQVRINSRLALLAFYGFDTPLVLTSIPGKRVLATFDFKLPSTNQDTLASSDSVAALKSYGDVITLRYNRFAYLFWLPLPLTLPSASASASAKTTLSITSILRLSCPAQCTIQLMSGISGSRELLLRLLSDSGSNWLSLDLPSARAAVDTIKAKRTLPLTVLFTPSVSICGSLVCRVCSGEDDSQSADVTNLCVKAIGIDLNSNINLLQAACSMARIGDKLFVAYQSGELCCYDSSSMSVLCKRQVSHAFDPLQTELLFWKQLSILSVLTCNKLIILNYDCTILSTIIEIGSVSQFVVNQQLQIGTYQICVQHNNRNGNTSSNGDRNSIRDSTEEGCWYLISLDKDEDSTEVERERGLVALYRILSTSSLSVSAVAENGRERNTQAISLIGNFELGSSIDLQTLSAQSSEYALQMSQPAEQPQQLQLQKQLQSQQQSDRKRKLIEIIPTTNITTNKKWSDKEKEKENHQQQRRAISAVLRQQLESIEERYNAMNNYLVNKLQIFFVLRKQLLSDSSICRDICKDKYSFLWPIRSNSNRHQQILRRLLQENSSIDSSGMNRFPLLDHINRKVLNSLTQLKQDRPNSIQPTPALNIATQLQQRMNLLLNSSSFCNAYFINRNTQITNTARARGTSNPTERGKIAIIDIVCSPMRHQQQADDGAQKYLIIARVGNVGSIPVSNIHLLLSKQQDNDIATAAALGDAQTQPSGCGSSCFGIRTCSGTIARLLPSEEAWISAIGVISSSVVCQAQAAAELPPQPLVLEVLISWISATCDSRSGNSNSSSNSSDEVLREQQQSQELRLGAVLCFPPILVTYHTLHLQNAECTSSKSGSNIALQTLGRLDRDYQLHVNQIRLKVMPIIVKDVGSSLPNSSSNKRDDPSSFSSVVSLLCKWLMDYRSTRSTCTVAPTRQFDRSASITGVPAAVNIDAILPKFGFCSSSIGIFSRDGMYGNSDSSYSSSHRDDIDVVGASHGVVVEEEQRSRMTRAICSAFAAELCAIRPTVFVESRVSTCEMRTPFNQLNQQQQQQLHRQKQEGQAMTRSSTAGGGLEVVSIKRSSVAVDSSNSSYTNAILVMDYNNSHNDTIKNYHRNDSQCLSFGQLVGINAHSLSNRWLQRVTTFLSLTVNSNCDHVNEANALVSSWSSQLQLDFHSSSSLVILTRIAVALAREIKQLAVIYAFTAKRKQQSARQSTAAATAAPVASDQYQLTSTLTASKELTQRLIQVQLATDIAMLSLLQYLR